MLDQLIVLAAEEDVFTIAERLTDGVETVLKGIALVVAIGIVIATYFRTRAWVPTLVAVVMAGAVLWAVNNASFLEGSTEETIESDAGDLLPQPLLPA